MDIEKVYCEVNEILDTINFSELFPKFHRFRFAVYNSREICLNGEMIPYNDNFFANTAIELDGEYTAIWNYEFSPVDDMEYLAYNIVHEMFHCFQSEKHEERYPSDFALMNYPNDLLNFSEKFSENRCLARACSENDPKAFAEFLSIRSMRMRKYPDAVKEELKAETIEGMAEYVGLKALRKINADKYNAVLADYAGKLNSESRLLFDIRGISYINGSLFFICMDLFGYDFANDFFGKLTPFETLEIPIADCKVGKYDFIQREYSALTAERENIVKSHINGARFTECSAYICGYDPSNMFRYKDYYYCSRFVCLDENGNVFSINDPVVLKLKDNSMQEISGYYLTR